MQAIEQSTVANPRRQVRIKSNRDYRAITFLPHGQQFNTWLPAGDYNDVGPVDLWIKELGRGEWCKVRELVGMSKNNHGKWYIGESVYANMVGGAQ